MKYRRLLVGALCIVFAIFLAIEAAGLMLAFRGAAGEEPRSARRPARNERPDDLKAKNTLLKAGLANLHPRGVYIVIDTGRSTLYLRDKKRVISEAVASSGSGSMLVEPSGKKKWVFDTPRGEYKIESKTRNPVWRKPDWAFIEEGKPIPKNAVDRLEEGVLGDYALGFGASYFIHGTLYTRLLGKNVTHGCVRLGDEDLKAVFRAVDIGTKVYIY
jgi:lipoprotein-anchoring transpeptidase ErfK/SrfK